MSETTLRDALSSALDGVEPETIDSAPPDDTPKSGMDLAGVAVETSTEKADRIRDEKGRFAAAAEAAKEAAKEVATPVPAPVDATASPEPVVERKPPSSWSKDYWEAYQKLDPKVADYIQKREQQFASGVSTYRQEAERAKELHEAIAPFTEDLQRYGIQPSTWIRNLGTAHQTLAKGSPEQKIAAFQKLAQDYNVPMHAVQSGQVDPMMQYVSPLQEQVMQLQGQINNWQQQQAQQQQATLQSEIERFAAEHEHFEAVRSTMGQLLDSGVANDLSSAYDKALRLNDDLWKAEQQRQSVSHQQAEAARVQKARAQAVSVRGSTPAGQVTSTGTKGLRAELEEQVSAFLSSGRV